ncbi:MAG: DUF559 domain-containing protein [Deltaproteobacteria bacterium]|nr:DUF559 domain-containing protein [Deltaproteobacteria bacterium]
MVGENAPVSQKGKMGKCEICGKDIYIRKNNPQRFCSQKCMLVWRSEYQRSERWPGRKHPPQTQYTCALCGRDFLHKTYTGVKAKKKHFCSKDCANRYKSLHPDKRRQGVVNICRNCGMAFYKCRAHKHAKYCSGECRRAAGDWKTTKGKRSGTVAKCLVCGKFFYVSPCLTGKKKFCSGHCSAVWRMTHKRVGITGLEQKVKMLLVRNGLRFQMQKPIGSYRVDFFLPPCYIIEADGEFWHNSPRMYAHDKRRDAILRSKGYQVLHLPGKVITENPNLCRNRILDFLKGGDAYGKETA